MPCYLQTRIKILALLVLMGAAGCADTTSVPPIAKVRLTAFSVDNPMVTNRKVFVSALDRAQLGTLEFESHRRIASNEMRSHGALIVESEREAQLVALVDFRIDSGRTEQRVFSTPIFGQTGVSSATTFGGVTTFQPTFGVVGSQTHSVNERIFTRHGAFDLYEKIGSTLRKVYEARAISEGSCGQPAVTARTILPVLFSSFPRRDATDARIDVPFPGEC
jgi:hypothetical protein